MLFLVFVCVCRFCPVASFSDVCGWISADGVLYNGLQAPSSTDMKTAIVIDSLSHLISSLSIDHVCQVLSRLTRHAQSTFTTDILQQ